MQYILILIMVGGGGSSPRPAVALESVHFNTRNACEVALSRLKKTPIPSVGSSGPRFGIAGICAAKS